MNYRYRVTYNLDVGVGGKIKVTFNTRNVEIPVDDAEFGQECRKQIKEVLDATHKNDTVRLLRIIKGAKSWIKEEPTSISEAKEVEEDEPVKKKTEASAGRPSKVGEFIKSARPKRRTPVLKK